MSYIGETTLKELLQKIKSTFTTMSQVEEKITETVGASIDYSVVETLPETGIKGTIYLVPSSISETNDIYDEYLYISDTEKFEHIGSTKTDLSLYLTADDIATASTWGIVKPDGSTITVDDKGIISAAAADVSWSNVKSKPFISLNEDNFEVDSTTGVLSSKGATINSINDISDVTIDTPAGDQVLKYDATTSTWINSDAPKGAEVSAEDGNAIIEKDDGLYVATVEGGTTEFAVSATQPADEDITLWLDTSESYGGGDIAVTDYNEYSTDEKVVGKWIDGRPIYRRVYSWGTVKSLASNTWVETSLLKEDLNVERIISGVNSYFDSSNNTSYSAPIIIASTSDSKYIRVLNTRPTAAISSSEIIFEYTKTTDPENSFDTSMLSYYPTDDITEEDVTDVINSL